MADVDAIHALTLSDVLREQRRSYPDRTAVVCGAHRLTYPELDDRVNRLANALADFGVTEGERVLWLAQNCHRFLETLLATARLGAICCPVNWRNSADEMAFVIDDARPKVVIWQHEEIGERVEAARTRARTGIIWVQHDAADERSYEGLVGAAQGGDPDVVVDPAASALMLYTAAFEDTPNGALLSQAAMLWQSLVWTATHNFTHETVYLASEPMFHVAGLMNLIGTLHRGGTNVFARRVDAEEICHLIQAEHCTTAYFVDKTINEIVELNKNGKYDLQSLRSPPRNPDWDAMVTIGKSPWDQMMGGYGQTEAMGMLTYHALGSRPPPGVQARIVDDEGIERSPGDAGELVSRGPTMMNGYYERPDLDARRQRDCWHHTNDLARREEDGSLVWLGSMDRLIKSGGENIYPAEVEACIKTHPAVEDCKVVGVPDPRFGQIVKALVVLRAGTPATADELIGHCQGRIASYKKPSEVEFVRDTTRR
jgi:acyl-CoA synthetase (AMP-forming)/AMP-acid ligase II